MAKFVVIYSGGMGMAASPDEQQGIQDEWGAWYGKMGPAVTDGGNPFGASKSLSGPGAAATDGPGDTPATGYTVIEADSLDAATAACSDHPHLDHQGVSLQGLGCPKACSYARIRCFDIGFLLELSLRACRHQWYQGH